MLVAASCSPIVDVRGHGLEDADFSQLVPNQSKQEDVRALFGSPSSTSSYGDPTWYYITVKKETLGIYAPEVATQHVTAIRFNADETVADVTNYSQQDGKAVQIVGKETPTEGHQLGFWEQMLGNFGRFNTPGRAIDPKGLGR
jgi:outer membrane protein assembly factor BamE (lipoprotein component of BamABCDE complex)